MIKLNYYIFIQKEKNYKKIYKTIIIISFKIRVKPVIPPYKEYGGTRESSNILRRSPVVIDDDLSFMTLFCSCMIRSISTQQTLHRLISTQQTVISIANRLMKVILSIT